MFKVGDKVRVISPLMNKEAYALYKHLEIDMITPDKIGKEFYITKIDTKNNVPRFYNKEEFYLSIELTHTHTIREEVLE